VTSSWFFLSTLHDVKVHVFCAVCTASITLPNFFSDTIHLQGIATLLTLKMIWKKSVQRVVF